VFSALVPPRQLPGYWTLYVRTVRVFPPIELTISFFPLAPATPPTTSNGCGCQGGAIRRRFLGYPQTPGRSPLPLHTLRRCFEVFFSLWSTSRLLQATFETLSAFNGSRTFPCFVPFGALSLFTFFCSLNDVSTDLKSFFSSGYEGPSSFFPDPLGVLECCADPLFSHPFLVTVQSALSNF